MRGHDEGRPVSLVNDVQLDVPPGDQGARDVVPTIRDGVDQRVLAVTTLQRRWTSDKRFVAAGLEPTTFGLAGHE